MTCRPSEGRPPQAIQARHQPDVAGAPSERLVAPRFCGVSIMEADQCFTITHCAVSEAASSASKSWWKRDHFRIAVLAFDLVYGFGTIRSGRGSTPIPCRSPQPGPPNGVLIPCRSTGVDPGFHEPAAHRRGPGRFRAGFLRPRGVPNKHGRSLGSDRVRRGPSSRQSIDPTDPPIFTRSLC